MTNRLRNAGVSPAVAWASCLRAERERDAPETAGKMPAPQRHWGVTAEALPMLP